MRGRRLQRGFLLIVAAILIVVAGVMAAAIATLTAGSGGAGALQLGATRAFFAAESGIEQVTQLFENGTSCSNLAATIGSPTVGAASYTVSATTYNPANTAISQAGGIGATDTTIPVPVNGTSGFAPHGLILIDSEQIVYTGITASSFTGATRGFAGTIAVPHGNGAAISQNQCLVRATATSGSAQRVVESALQFGPWAAYYDLAPGTSGDSTAISASGQTNLGTLTTSFQAATSTGGNLIIAVVTLQDTTGADQLVAGNLALVRNYGLGSQTTLASNAYPVRVGNSPDNNNNRTGKTYFFVYRDAAAPSAGTYSIVSGLAANVGNNGISAEVKMLAINNPPVSLSTSGNNGGAFLSKTSFSTIATTNATGLAAGDNIVIARAQINNPRGGGGADNIAAGNLQLIRSGAAQPLASNQYTIYAQQGNQTTQEYSHLLLALDANAPSNPTYSIQAQAALHNNSLQAEGTILVIKGMGSAYVEGGSVANIATTGSTLATLATSFPALYSGRNNLVIAATQYDNPSTSTANISAGTEAIVYSGTNQAVNTYQYTLCSTNISVYCRHFPGGELWQQASAATSPSFSVTATTNVANSLSGEAKILAMHLNPIADEVEAPH